MTSGKSSFGFDVVWLKGHQEGQASLQLLKHRKRCRKWEELCEKQNYNKYLLL